MGGRDDPPWVSFPERLDRRMRLGPFPSGRAAVKFVVAAAVGAIVSLAVDPWAGLPIVAVGAFVAMWQLDGEPLDDRAVALARWSVRRLAGAPPMREGVGGTTDGSATVLHLADGRSAAIVRTGGVPLAFLPPSELAGQFDRYRQMLRAVEGGIIVLATSAPIYAAAVLPREPTGEAAERSAQDGYRELVTLLARRRSVRRVLVAVVQDASGPEASRRLESAVDLLRERLADLGVRSERLRARALADAARRLGFTGAEGGR